MTLKRVLETHLIGFVCDSRVVLDLPEPLGEAFPLFRFSKLFLMFIIREQIVGPQECPAGPGYRWITSDYAPRSTSVSHFGFADLGQCSLLTSHEFRRRRPGTCWKGISPLLQVARQSAGQKQPLNGARSLSKNASIIGGTCSMEHNKKCKWQWHWDWSDLMSKNVAFVWTHLLATITSRERCGSKEEADKM